MAQESLKKFLEYAAECYYSGAPIIPDETFDALSEEAQFDKVGAAGGDTALLYELKSLEKFYIGEKEPNRTFDSPIKTVKLDGAHVAAIYFDGKLHKVVTRGDGLKGQDITDKFLSGKYIPLEVSFKQHMQVSLECVAPKTITNSRNYASGALDLKDIAEFDSRDLTFIAHDVKPSITGDKYTSDMSELSNMGFQTVLENDGLDRFPQDGTVVRENDIDTYYSYGETRHHFKGAYALKTRKEGVVTTLRDVVWQVGKSGKVTPVAIFDAVDIDGASVTRATLHNPGFIEAMQLDIGDRIEVARAGEIIPAVIRKL